MTDQAAARPDDQVNGEGPRPTRWRGVIGFNLLSAIVLALLGYAIGEWIGQRIGTHIDFVAATDQNDVALLLGYVLAVVGWLVGLGFLNYPLGRMIGRSVDLPVREPRGSAATSGSRPTTRSSGCSTSWESGSSSSSAGSTRC